MAIQRIDIQQFLTRQPGTLVIDVRSPGEFSHAHIPGAKNLPLFNDEERAQVGTAYKQKSREQAIKIGLDFFGVKMHSMVEQVEGWLMEVKKELADQRLPQLLLTEIPIIVHCWRGGMRSAGVAWLIDFYGFRVSVLEGGYKNYRAFIRETFERPYLFKVLGGYTGSGKTIILHALAEAGEPIIDLENLAAHKGSAFGALGQKPQPSQEMFENKLGMALHQYYSEEGHTITPIWIEDESQRIGNLQIPPSLWNTIRNSKIFFVEIPFEERLEYLTRDYGTFDKEQLISAVLRIQRRLGGLETKRAINFIIEDNFKESFRVLLRYYDVYYLKGLEKRDNLSALLNKQHFRAIAPAEIAKTLIYENKAR